MNPELPRRDSAAAGAEPGINPRHTSSARFRHFQQECVIEVADYTADDISVKRLSNAELVDFIKLPDLPLKSGLAGSVRPGVRWINIGGVDWDVMSSLALKYGERSRTLKHWT